MYLMTSYSKGTLYMVCRHRRLSSSHHTETSIDPTHRQLTGKLNYYFVFKPESRLLNMHDSIFFVLHASLTS
jgi:hypothetical protein